LAIFYLVISLIPSIIYVFFYLHYIQSYSVLYSYLFWLRPNWKICSLELVDLMETTYGMSGEIYRVFLYLA